jgi:tetratricopeptide (TPR) repeat protein
MAELTQEQAAFLKQRIPENYVPVREPVVYIRDLLAIKKMIVAAPDPESANLELVGQPMPVPGLTVNELQTAVRHSCKAIDYDRECAQAYVLLVRGVIELSRYDEMVVHPVPLREVLPLAQRGKSIDEKNADPWAAYIEINIHLKRWDIVTENLAHFRARKFDAKLSAELSLLAAKGQELPADEVLWYDKLLALTQLSADRAELHGKQGMAYLKLKMKKEADECFHRALVEGGPLSWVAHQWSMLKDDLGVRPAAIELNRRASNFDNENRAAKAYAELLRAPFRRFGHPFPGPAALEEEKIRGIALPGCDPAVEKAANLRPYEPPKSVTRAIAKREATRILNKGKSGPANISTGEGAISLARSLTPDEPIEQDDTTVGAGYLEQSGDAVTLRNLEKEKHKDKKDDSGMLVPRDADVPLAMPSTRTIRRTELDKQPPKAPDSPQSKIVRRAPMVPMGTAAPTPDAPPTGEEKEAPPKVQYVRPKTGQFQPVKPATGQAPALKPPTAESRALRPPTGQSPALPQPESPTRVIRPPTGQVPVLPIPVAPLPPIPVEPKGESAEPAAESAPALEPASEGEKTAFRPEPPKEPPTPSV